MAVALTAGQPVALAQPALTLDAAIRRAVDTNPQIGEAAANRRAVDQELRQVQGGLLPQVRVTAEAGVERTRRFDTLVATPASPWRQGGEAGLAVRQLLYDGGATLNEIYRQMARSEGAAHRARERAELVALDTAEAYLDILRYQASIDAARRNVLAHAGYLRNVQARVAAGRTGSAELFQVREHLSGAHAVEAELRLRLEEARASFRRSVGSEPGRLVFPSRLAGLPETRELALGRAVQHNATLLAVRADVTAAQRQALAADAGLGPTVAVELRAAHGRNSSQNVGAFDEASARVVASWSLYDGGTLQARRYELAERVGEQQMRLSTLQRAATESIDRAWSAREVSRSRIAFLNGQVRAAQQTVLAYRSEYELDKKTVLDLLNAENALLSARLALAAAQSLAVFADYQLLAAIGDLLPRVRAEPPREATPPPMQASLLPQLLPTTAPQVVRLP